VTVSGAQSRTSGVIMRLYCHLRIISRPAQDHLAVDSTRRAFVRSPVSHTARRAAAERASASHVYRKGMRQQQSKDLSVNNIDW
jgi:hypothetical protein